MVRLPDGPLLPALLVITMAAAPVAAVEVSIFPFRDNSLFENDPNASSGAGPILFCGETGKQSRRMVVYFDTRLFIPSGSIINRVELHMFVAQAGGAALPGRGQGVASR